MKYCGHCGQANPPQTSRCQRCDTDLAGVLPVDGEIPIGSQVETWIQLQGVPYGGDQVAYVIAQCGDWRETSEPIAVRGTAPILYPLHQLLEPVLAWTAPVSANVRTGGISTAIHLVRAKLSGPRARAVRLGSRTAWSPLTANAGQQATPAWAVSLSPYGPGTYEVSSALEGLSTPLELLAELDLQHATDVGVELRLKGSSGTTRLLQRVRLTVAAETTSANAALVVHQPDYTQQIGFKGRLVENSLSYGDEVELVAKAQFVRAGRFEVALANLSAAAVTYFECEVSDQNAFRVEQATPTQRTVLVNRPVEVTVRVRLVPSQLNDEAIERIASNPDVVAVPIKLVLQEHSGATAAGQRGQVIVALGEIQLWCAKDAQLLAMDFGTSETTVSIQLQTPDESLFEQVTLGRQLIELVLNGTVGEDDAEYTAPQASALRVERHGRPLPDSVVAGDQVLREIDGAGNWSRSVMLIKRLMSEGHTLMLSDRPIQYSHLSTSSPLTYQRYDAAELAHAYLRFIANEVAAKGSLPRVILLSFPGSWYQQQGRKTLQELEQLVATAFQHVRDRHRPGSGTTVKAQGRLSEPECLLFHEVVRSAIDNDLMEQMKRADALVVVDVGGGTTDVATVIPGQLQKGQRVLRNVQAAAENFAGEDLTHAIAAALWVELGNVRLSGKARNTLASVRFPDTPQQRFSSLGHMEPDVQELVKDTFRMAELLKTRQIEEVSAIGRYRFETPFTTHHAETAASSVVKRIAEVSERMLITQLSQVQWPSTTRNFLVFAGGNGMRYQPLARALESVMRSAAERMGGRLLSIGFMGESAKKGVSVGCLMHEMVSSLNDDVLTRLPFRWAGRAQQMAQQVYELIVSPRPTTRRELRAMPEPQFFKQFVPDEYEGFQQSRLEAWKTVGTTRWFADLSPGAMMTNADARRLWLDLDALTSEQIRRAEITLTQEGVILRVVDHDSQCIAEREVRFSDLVWVQK